MDSNGVGVDNGVSGCGIPGVVDVSDRYRVIPYGFGRHVVFDRVSKQVVGYPYGKQELAIARAKQLAGFVARNSVGRNGDCSRS